MNHDSSSLFHCRYGGQSFNYSNYNYSNYPPQPPPPHHHGGYVHALTIRKRIRTSVDTCIIIRCLFCHCGLYRACLVFLVLPPGAKVPLRGLQAALPTDQIIQAATLYVLASNSVLYLFSLPPSPSTTDNLMITATHLTKPPWANKLTNHTHTVLSCHVVRVCTNYNFVTFCPLFVPRGQP